VCLAWALERFACVETVGIAYGQRHAVELEQRQTILKAIRAAYPGWAARLGEDHVLTLTELGALSETALTRDAEIEMTDAGLPSTFVPGRNLLFFTYAAALAYRRGIRTLIGGMCETDYSGYPDCRHETIEALAKAISLGMGTEFQLVTPLMWLDKAATWQMAQDLGGTPFIDLIIEHAHTCYRGNRATRHPWGFGCGTCPACELRAKGWEKWRAAAAG
jgi:7-cyano-7-deazaguanine synthase